MIKNLSKRITDSHDKLMKMNAGQVDEWMAEVDETARARAEAGEHGPEIVRRDVARESQSLGAASDPLRRQSQRAPERGATE